ncbi:MAG: YraN family protein [Beijerinckiaceae bacterium]
MKRRRSTRDRRRALRLGHAAEFAAALWLMAKGYRILARRYSAHGGEIDLIARRGRTVAFIEVKRRNSLETAQDAISFVKVERFARAADAWLARNPWAADRILRADAILLAPRRWPRHVENAFQLAGDVF